MKKPTFTLARIMVVVGITAVNIAAARALYREDIELALGLALMALVSQFALICAIKRLGLARAFWSGFVIASIAAMAVFAWGFSVQDSALFGWLLSYTQFADGVLALIPYAPRLYISGGSNLPVMMTAAFVWFIPQLMAAVVGGLFATFVAWMNIKRVENRYIEPTSPSSS